MPVSEAAQQSKKCLTNSIPPSLPLSQDVVFLGPVGSGKSSLIGSIYRSINQESKFPPRVSLTLHHPKDDSHGTMHWMETRINPKGTIVYQDTRGDKVSGNKDVEFSFYSSF